MKRLIVVALIAALVSGGGVYVWQNQQQAQRVEELELQVSDLRSKASSEPAPAPAATKTDAEQIGAVLKADCQAATAAKAPTIKDIKVSGEFASANVTCSGATEYSVLKKVDGTWTIVFAGTGRPDAARVKLYAIPKEFQ